VHRECEFARVRLIVSQVTGGIDRRTACQYSFIEPCQGVPEVVEVENPVAEVILAIAADGAVTRRTGPPARQAGADSRQPSARSRDAI
jgi:hypothetical protein